MSDRQSPLFFESAAAFREWLVAYHATAPELRLGLYKKTAGKASVTYAEALDEALCFGWIDGITHRIDGDSYTIRFTPRRRGSTWSAVNIKRMGELEAAGRVEASGREAFERRDAARAIDYAHETQNAAFSPEFEREFRAHVTAWAFWESQPPGYRRTATFWVTSAKQEPTRLRRLRTLIEDSAAGRRIAPLAPRPKPG